MWLDDARDPSQYNSPGSSWVKNVDEAIALLQTGVVKWASLDHDVQFDGRNGLTVLKWMLDNDVWPPGGIIVHSTNIEARELMLAMVRTYYGRDWQGPEFLQW